jgi:peptidoglycan hydrolase-like protein with peptidoglycan-binding domain
MRSTALAASLIALAGCSTASPPSPSVAVPAPQRSAAQSEAQASTRDSSATRDDIKSVQGRLTRDDFYHGPVDGVWGPATASALGRYQRAHGLEATEKLDQPTRDSFAP